MLSLMKWEVYVLYQLVHYFHGASFGAKGSEIIDSRAVICLTTFQTSFLVSCYRVSSSLFGPILPIADNWQLPVVVLVVCMQLRNYQGLITAKKSVFEERNDFALVFMVLAFLSPFALMLLYAVTA